MTARPVKDVLTMVVGMTLATLIASAGLVGLSAPTPVAALSSSPQAAALSGSDFNPESIISDSLFFDGSAMSAGEIQNFLDSQIGSCQNGQCLNIAVIDFPGRPREVSSVTGRVVCEAIAGGVILASELIYRTQVACGISAKVILVTMQKEQSLVTSTAPGTWALTRAMGMGCPDTAPCNDAFAGLGVQITTGTAQLKRYSAGAFARQPGEHFIGYHPNSDCGGTWLTVRNYATAALYNYTPYQPNSAALANLSGTGDSCSSYGNRNFWRFYNNWFGSATNTAAIAAIDAHYAQLGGASGPLGTAGEVSSCTVGLGVCQRTYQNGVIGWSAAGAFAVTGDIAEYFVRHGGVAGALRAPDSAAVAIAGGANGAGYNQSFQGGLVSSSSLGTFSLRGAIREQHGALGGVGGPAGWPKADAVCSGSNCVQEFQHTVVGRVGSLGYEMPGSILAYYRANGFTGGSLGLPNSLPVSMAGGSNGSGVNQSFQGALVSSSASGTFSLRGAIRDKHGALGGVAGRVGWPIADAACSGTSCVQDFQHATLGSLGTTTYEMPPAIATYFRANGGVAGVLGAPNSLPAAMSGGSNGSGYNQSFANALVSSSASGTFALRGAIRDEHGRLGGVAGQLGWPAGDAVCSGNSCTQQFQHGSLVSAGSQSYVFSSPAIASYFQSKGGVTGALGAPVSSTVPMAGGSNGAGFNQAFANALVSSSSNGTFALKGAIRTEHGRLGGVAGSLGWPLGEESCSAGTCTQEFQHGIITVSGNQVSVARR